MLDAAVPLHFYNNKTEIVSCIRTNEYKALSGPYIENDNVKSVNQKNVKRKDLIKEIKKVCKYKIVDVVYEKIDDELTVIGLKLKDFPESKNKVAYSVELIDKIKDFPENFDIFIA